MKKDFSKHWKASKQPRKQRKYAANATLKDKRRFLSATLSKELRKKYGKRSIPIRKEDEVSIMRGQFRKTKGKVSRVLLKKSLIYVEGAQLVKKDGSKTYYPIHPSNVMITSLNLDDKGRKKVFDRVKNVTSEKVKGS
ncbi:MAG: 50S ribosomal protein L24 [Candidatus Woesearchaeota archaeon]